MNRSHCTGRQEGNMDRKTFLKTLLLIPKKWERPPGANVDDKQFLKLCTGCDACMVACPHNVVMIEDLERRDPVIYPDEGPCLHCADYPCITACPTGALSLQDTHAPAAG